MLTYAMIAPRLMLPYAFAADFRCHYAAFMSFSLMFRAADARLFSLLLMMLIITRLSPFSPPFHFDLRFAFFAADMFTLLPCHSYRVITNNIISLFSRAISPLFFPLLLYFRLSSS